MFRFKGSGGRLLGQILFTLALSIVTFGIYLPFGIFFILRWITRQIWVNGTPLELRYNSKKLLPILALIGVSPFLITYLFNYDRWFSFKIHLRMFLRNYESYDLRRTFDDLYNIVPIIIVPLLACLMIPWLAAAIFRLVVNNTCCEGKRFQFSDTCDSFDYGNCLFKYMLISIIPNALTFGIYTDWINIRILRDTLRWIQLDGHVLNFYGGFLTNKRILTMALKIRLLTILTAGVALPWLICEYYRQIISGIGIDESEIPHS